MSILMNDNVDVDASLDPKWILICKSITEVFRPYLGNGYMGVKIAGEGTNWKSDHPHLIAGVYLKDKPRSNDYFSFSEKICAAPKWSGIGLHNGTATFGRGQGTVNSYSQVQNLKKGYLRTRCRWSEGGKDIDIDVLFFISRVNPHLGAIRYSVVPHFDGKICFTCMLDGNDLHYSGYMDCVDSNLSEISRGYDASSQMIWLHTYTNFSIRIGNALLAELEGADASFSYRDSGKKVVQSIEFDARSGHQYTLYTYATVFTSHDTVIPLEAAKREALNVRSLGWKSLFTSHVSRWDELWRTGIVVSGEEVVEDQRRINANIFNLLQSMREEGSWVGMGPSCLSDGFYYGTIFWDADYWAWMPMAFLYRDFAQPLLDYRYLMRREARNYAADEGYQGYKWPWISALTGREMAGEHHRDQLHISGWVCLSHWNYFLLTRDKNWLRKRGYPIMKGTAEFWTSRVTWVDSKKCYEVRHVVPPLEQGIKDNCTITAALIRRNLLDTIRATELLDKVPDPKWKDIADKIWLPFDEKNRIYLQYENYDGHNIDQSSASLMIFPVEHPMDNEIKMNMVDYYYSRLNPDQPVVAYATFGIIQSELGRNDAAWSLYQEHYSKSMHGAFHIWIEHPARPTWNFFMQSCGSCLQHVVFGFAGIRIRHDGVCIKPSLPKKWTGLEITQVKIGGGVYNIAIDERNVPTVTKLNGVANVNIYNEKGESLNDFH